MSTQPKAVPAPEARCSRCEWLIFHGRLAALCPSKATHVDPSSGSVFCETHAEDFEEVFGDVLQSLPQTPEVSP